ncbi:28415_t:CDS:2, partial [Racocetra persica]
FYLDPSSPPKEANILPSRYEPFTFLLKPRHFNIFESWIEEADQNDKKTKNLLHKFFSSNNLNTNEKKGYSGKTTLNTKPKHFSNNNLYDFVLLYRGKENDFNAEKFHKLCDNKGPTLTIVKLTDQRLFGGYNDLNTEHHYFERKNTLICVPNSFEPSLL